MLAPFLAANTQCLRCHYITFFEFWQLRNRVFQQAGDFFLHAVLRVIIMRGHDEPHFTYDKFRFRLEEDGVWLLLHAISL